MDKSKENCGVYFLNKLSKDRKNELAKEVREIVEKFYKEFPQFKNKIIPDSFEAAEELGFFIVATKAPFQLSGFTTSYGDYHLLALNSRHTKARQNYSIWHEIYHWYTGDGKEVSLSKQAEYVEAEYKAEYFAACILINEEVLKNKVSKLLMGYKNHLTNKDIFTLAHEFNSSVISMLRRIIEVTGDRSLWSRVKNIQDNEFLICKYKEFGLSTDLELPTNSTYISPSLFEYLSHNLKDNRISESRVELIVKCIEEEFYA